MGVPVINLNKTELLNSFKQFISNNFKSVVTISLVLVLVLSMVGYAAIYKSRLDSKVSDLQKKQETLLSVIDQSNQKIQELTTLATTLQKQQKELNIKLNSISQTYNKKRQELNNVKTVEEAKDALQKNW